MNHETIIWEGRSSQFVNFGTYFLGTLGILFFLNMEGNLFTLGMLAVIAILVKMLWEYLQTRYDTYTITNERIKREEGLIVRQTYDIELWRVKDVLLSEPIWYRMFGLGTIQLISTQVGASAFYLRAVPNPKQIREQIRRIVTDSNTWLLPQVPSAPNVLELPS